MDSRLQNVTVIIALSSIALLCSSFESFAERQFKDLQYCIAWHRKMRQGISVSSFNCEMDALSRKHRFNAIRHFVLLIHVLLAQEMFMQII